MLYLGPIYPKNNQFSRPYLKVIFNVESEMGRREKLQITMWTPNFLGDQLMHVSVVVQQALLGNKTGIALLAFEVPDPEVALQMISDFRFVVVDLIAQVAIEFAVFDVDLVLVIGSIIRVFESLSAVAAEK
jgi:hypothetical protein